MTTIKVKIFRCLIICFTILFCLCLVEMVERYKPEWFWLNNQDFSALAWSSTPDDDRYVFYKSIRKQGCFKGLTKQQLITLLGGDGRGYTIKQSSPFTLHFIIFTFEKDKVVGCHLTQD